MPGSLGSGAVLGKSVWGYIWMTILAVFPEMAVTIVCFPLYAVRRWSWAAGMIEASWSTESVTGALLDVDVTGDEDSQLHSRVDVAPCELELCLLLSVLVIKIKDTVPFIFISKVKY